jgi:hypothetical protein
MDRTPSGIGTIAPKAYMVIVAVFAFGGSIGSDRTEEAS